MFQILITLTSPPKLPKNDHFLVCHAIAGQDGPGSKNFLWSDFKSDYTWSNGTEISSIRTFKKATGLRNFWCVQTGSFFGPGFTGVKVLRSRQTWYQNFGHQMLYKLYFDHFPHNSQRKKLFAKNIIFDYPQKHVFRAYDARDWRARHKNNFPERALGQCTIVQNCSPICQKLRPAFFLKRFWLVF